MFWNRILIKASCELYLLQFYNSYSKYEPYFGILKNSCVVNWQRLNCSFTYVFELFFQPNVEMNWNMKRYLPSAASCQSYFQVCIRN